MISSGAVPLPTGVPLLLWISAIALSFSVDDVPSVRVAAAALEEAQAELRVVRGIGPFELEFRALSADPGVGEIAATAPVWRHERAPEIAAAHLRVEAAAARLEGARAEAWAAVGIARASAQAAMHARKLWDESLLWTVEGAELARLRAAAGLANPLEVSLWAAEGLRDQSARMEADQQLQLALLDLATLGAELAQGDALGCEHPPPSADALRHALPISSAWRALQHDHDAHVQGARAHLRGASLRVGPALNLGTEGPTWGLAVGAELPSPRGRVRARNAADQSAAAELVEGERALLRDAEATRLAWTLAWERLQVYAGEERAAHEGLDSARSAYASGQMDMSTALAAVRANTGLALDQNAQCNAVAVAELRLSALLGQYPLVFSEVSP